MGKRDKYTVGRTIAGSTHRGHSETLAREALHRRKKRKNALLIGCVVMILAALGIGAYSLISDFEQQREFERLQAERKALQPTVEIHDENAGENISTRVNEFVVELEGDVRDMGQEIDHVVLPFQKAREVVVFLKGREEYYKLSLDRGTAVQSEDMARMLNYLDEAQLKVSYVDLRVEGRAYYK